MTKAQQAEREKAKEQLRKWLAPGDTVYCILRHVSRSGMQREIGTVIFVDGTDLHPNYLIAQAIGWRQGKRDGIIADGCGMDMGFHLVYTLSRALFPDGFATTVMGRHPHYNGVVAAGVGGAVPRTREDYAACYADGWRFVGGRNGDDSGWDTDGGYALRHRWL